MGNLAITCLGSGSRGNAYFVEDERQALLIDQGFPCRELEKRMAQSGCNCGKLVGALLSHDHSDHSGGSRVFCDKYDLPLFTAGETALYLQSKQKLPKKVLTFSPGDGFSFENFYIKTFPVPHDAQGPVGFSIVAGDMRITIATDLGGINENVIRELSDSDVLVLESNYDPDMLMNSARPLELKRRIIGPRGHLDNYAVQQVLPKVLSSRTQLLLLAHISQECNRYELVGELCRKTLKEAGYCGLNFGVLRQGEPSEKFSIHPPDCLF